MKVRTSRAVLWILGISLAIVIVILIALRLSSVETPIPTKIQPPSNRTSSFSLTPSSRIDPNPFQKVRLAWFYKPPDDQLLPVLAEKFDLFILTHKDEAERDALKSLGVKSPIYLYLQILEIKVPGSCDETPQGNQAAYQVGDFCEISAKHPDWFLLDQNGSRIIENNSVSMDPGNMEYRAFWLQRARTLLEQYHWDGLFIDNLEASMSELTMNGIVPAKYPDDASYQAAIEGFLKYIRDNYFASRRQPILANIISIQAWNMWLDYLQYLDGAMIEAFAVGWNHDYRSVSDWEKQVAASDEALSRRKKLILVAQANESDPNRQQFAFASYLLIANNNTYFRYADGSDGYRELSLYENYNLDLGNPVSARYKQGSFWRRDFTNGYVLVDPGQHTAEIKLNP
jgi:Hypothetical glycosyl hydrolase family 15